MIELELLDRDLNKILPIDDYSSLIWSSRYYKCGDFELCLPIKQKYIENILTGYYIARKDDENTGVIEDLEFTIDEDNKEWFVVTGRFLPSLLARRIIEKQTQISGTIQTGITKLINENAISPTNSNRKIPNLTIKSATIYKNAEAQYTGKNLLETIEDICSTNSVGFKTILTEDKKFEFSLYEGVNRSYSQFSNPFIVFSDDNDNLISSSYKYVTSEMVTDVLVAGEGEGLDRKTKWVSNFSNSGLDRYEAYKDQRDLSTNDGAISDEEYQAQLQQAGLESLTNITSAFEGSVYFGNIKYKTDVNLGDIVTVKNKKWGVSINTRLIEVIESVDETGAYEILPTFGV